jgi:hypothetical protein
MFNGEHYLQISGTAMGTKMAPSYANIFMGRLERRLLHYAPTKPLSWLRFIDDIEMKWVDGRDSFNDLIEMANSSHYSIKFTLEVSTSKNIFWIPQQHLRMGKLILVFTLNPQTHSKVCLKAWLPASAASAFKEQGNILKVDLTNRGYNSRKVQCTIDEMSGQDRQEPLQYNVKPHNDRVPLVTTYHAGLRDLISILRKHFAYSTCQQTIG